MSLNLSPFCGGTYKLIWVLLRSEAIVQAAFATEGSYFLSKSDALRYLVCHLIYDVVLWLKKKEAWSHHIIFTVSEAVAEMAYSSKRKLESAMFLSDTGDS